MDEQAAATTSQWNAKPALARLLRVVALLAPLAASIGFVHVASKVVPAPSDSFWLYGLWWLGLSAAATVVLIGIDRACRRLLPLAALLKLSLVFPDQAPSRFKAAIRNGSVGSLEERIAEARTGKPGETPVEAAERLLGLVAALDAHDRLTRGHSDRVRAYSQMIGEELGLSKHEVELLNWAALLHDIGKLGVPGEILTKPGRPTDAEWETLKRHPEVGLELIEPLRSWLGEWSQAVGHHHERWDGRGYPHGLAGDEISLAGRIVAVSDVFDVMTSARSYKSAGGAIEARNELARCADTQFDPRVVRAFLAVSLGRLRFAMGPLSWLAHAPILGRIPLTPAIGAVSGTLAAATAVVATGLVEPPVRLAEPLASPPALAAPADPERPQRRSAAAAATDVKDPIRPRTVRVAVPPADVPAPEVPAASSTEPAVANEAPRPEDDAVETREGESITVDVLANDTDPDGDALSLSRVAASTGSAAIVGNRLHWTPPGNFHGHTSIEYVVADTNGATASGRVSVAVTPINDAPVAVDDTASVPEEGRLELQVLTNDSDIDGDELKLELVGTPSAGTATRQGSTLVYVAPRDFAGTVRIRYGIADGRGGTAAAFAAITVRAVGDAPVAQPDSATVAQGASVDLDVLKNDTDADGEALTLSAVGKPSQGSAEIANNWLRFHVPADATGEATMTYTVTDASGASATGTLVLTIVDVNQAPSFVGGGGQSVLEDAGAQTVTGWASSISAGTADESGQSVAFLVSNGASALFSDQPEIAPDGTLTYTPADDASGFATVTVQAVDDGGTDDGGSDTSAPQTFTITVLAVNDVPSFAAGPDQLVGEDDGPVSTAGWASSIDAGAGEAGQAVSFLVTNDDNALFSQQPDVAADGTLTFTPAPNASGSATVTVKARDDGGTANGGANTSAGQTFDIVVAASPDAPVATDDAASGSEDSAGVTFNVLANDTDADPGAVLTVSSHDDSGIDGGTLTDNGGGSFTYVPAADVSGSDTFTYVVSDGSANDTGTVTITVTPVPDAPIAAVDAYTTAAGADLVVAAPGLIDNDVDQDGDTLVVQATPIAAPANGTLTLGTDGSFTYTPNPPFVGTDSFTYRVDDGTGRTDDATVTITVSSTGSTDVYYLRSTGPSADVWNMTIGAPAGALPVPDWDGDGDPGLTIKSSDGDEGNADPREFQDWVSPAPSAVNGPVRLRLWSTTGQLLGGDAHPHAYLYDCDNSLVSCTLLLAEDIYVAPWGGLLGGWAYHDLTLGSLTHTFGGGRVVRVRLLVDRNDVRIALTGEYPSSLLLTLP